MRLYALMRMLLLGWPLYLLANVSGREYNGHASHFDPYSPIFSKRERSEIIVSDAALGVVLYGLYSVASTFGWAWFCKVRDRPGRRLLLIADSCVMVLLFRQASLSFGTLTNYIHVQFLPDFYFVCRASSSCCSSGRRFFPSPHC